MHRTDRVSLIADSLVQPAPVPRLFDCCSHRSSIQRDALPPGVMAGFVRGALAEAGHESPQARKLVRAEA